jgi:pimeloyl-ACP methyl ester carboxylesterase
MKKLVSLFVAVVLVVSVYAQNPSIYPVKSGKGAALLMLPGFTTPGSVWDETINSLEGDYQTIQISYAGFNGHPAIEMPWYSTIKNDLIEYLENEKLKDVIIIGHSMGGMLAMEIASEAPELVSKLIIVDALPCMRALMMPGVPAEAIQYESPYNQQMLQQTDSARLAMAKMMSMNMTMKKERVEQLVQWSMEADLETYVYGYTDLLKVDLRPTLAQIKAETLVLGASFPNRDLVVKNLRDQFTNLAGAEIVVAENSKHFIMFDQPEWLSTQMNKFLAE